MKAHPCPSESLPVRVSQDDSVVHEDVKLIFVVLWATFGGSSELSGHSSSLQLSVLYVVICPFPTMFASVQLFIIKSFH